MADEEQAPVDMHVVTLDQYKDTPVKEGFTGDHVIKRGNPNKDSNTGKFSTEARARLSRTVHPIKLYVKER